MWESDLGAQDVICEHKQSNYESPHSKVTYDIRLEVQFSI